MDTRYTQLNSLLTDLQFEMQACGVWAITAPSSEALMSDQPFCVDTLSFEHWLQFVMLPRFNWMMLENMALPNQCDIAPMAEEAFKGRKLEAIVFCLARIDELLTVS